VAAGQGTVLEVLEGQLATELMRLVVIFGLRKVSRRGLLCTDDINCVWQTQNGLRGEIEPYFRRHMLEGQGLFYRELTEEHKQRI
jgi:hypothetical protein